jgi:hypothetical protein
LTKQKQSLDSGYFFVKGNMYLVSYNKSDLLETQDLRYPNKKEKAFIQIAYEKLILEAYHKRKTDTSSYKKLPLLKNIKWYVKEAKAKDSRLSGIATLLSPEKYRLSSTYPYAICITSFVFKESYEYIIYVLTHEIKHCIPEQLKNGRWWFFKTHDVNLWGENAKNEKAIFGFFNDEWKDIACCDNLMKIFKSCHGIEEFLG